MPTAADFDKILEERKESMNKAMEAQQKTDDEKSKGEIIRTPTSIERGVMHKGGKRKSGKKSRKGRKSRKSRKIKRRS